MTSCTMVTQFHILFGYKLVLISSTAGPFGLECFLGRVEQCKESVSWGHPHILLAIMGVIAREI